MDGLKQLGFVLVLALVLAIERAIGLPGWFLLGVWWWVSRMPSGWPRIVALTWAGLWLGSLYALPLTLGLAVITSWYLAMDWLPTHASWQTLRLIGLLAIWMLLVAVLGQVPITAWSVGYLVGVIGMVTVVSRIVIIWDQRLQLSAWWRFQQQR